MANERAYPMLPCADIDAAIAFYEALGFQRTYRQLKPNPSAVVAREDFHVHLFGMDGFVPEDSYGSVIVVVPDADALYQDFAAGLRAAYGKLPVKGIPRITRPRKKFGTVAGFSVVDVGGNWLRFYRAGSETEEGEKKPGLVGQLEVAARLGDAHGDEAKAFRTLENALQRFPDAPTADRARALLYLAELATRLGDGDRARSSLAEAKGLALGDEERLALEAEFEHAAEVVG